MRASAESDKTRVIEEWATEIADAIRDLDPSNRSRLRKRLIEIALSATPVWPPLPDRVDELAATILRGPALRIDVPAREQLVRKITALWQKNGESEPTILVEWSREADFLLSIGTEASPGPKTPFAESALLVHSPGYLRSRSPCLSTLQERGLRKLAELAANSANGSIVVASKRIDHLAAEAAESLLEQLPDLDDLKLFGVQIPGEIAALVAPVAILGSLLVLLAGVRAARRHRARDPSIRPETVWLVLENDRVARLPSLASFAVLPPASLAYTGVRLQPNEPGTIALYAASALAACGLGLAIGAVVSSLRDDFAEARPAAAAEPRPADGHVLVNPNGGKYHGAGCRFTGPESRIVPVDEARADGLEPCARCLERPPPAEPPEQRP